MKLTPRFDEAYRMAADLHRRQVRKGSDTPYLSHLLAVAALVLEHGGDEDTAIAALLHDAVEDQGGAQTLDLIRQCFGDRVASIVASVSDDVPDRAGAKAPWEQRKRAYITGLAHHIHEARLVSAADKLANARSILSDLGKVGDAVWDRFKKGREGTLWYYRQLADTFVRLGPAAVASELNAAVLVMEHVAGAAIDAPHFQRPATAE